MLGPLATDRAAVAAARTKLDAEMAKYRAESPDLTARAKAFAADYDTLNVHDDQFDAADALVSIAVSAAAVAALVDNFAVLAVSWLFGAAGIVMGLAGFLGWSLHPDFLARLLG